MIDPRVASGTRDILPQLAIQRNKMIQAFRETFESYGFVPIDTPVLERREVLYAKGGQEVQRQVFEIAARGQLLEEGDLAMRFDLTVPLARFMARHVNEVGVPFKRYHIGLVYRGERAQKGRYREFYQCDFDTIGVQSVLSDAEIGLVICNGLAAVGIEKFTLRMNNRKILNAMLDSFGVAERGGHVLRSLDKLSKIGRAGVSGELQFGDKTREKNESDRILNSDQAERILDFIENTTAVDVDESISALTRELKGNARAEEGLTNLKEVSDLLVTGGVDPNQLRVEIGLARGLDYYTGIVYETTIDGYEKYGSVCSGGRYDDLASLFTPRQLPGIGASFGLDRLAQLMSDADLLETTSSVTPILVINFQDQDVSHYVEIASTLREAGIATEVYPSSKPLRDQFGYASSRGHRFAIVAGPDELQNQCFSLRNMTDRQQQRDLPLDELVDRVQQALKT